MNVRLPPEAEEIIRERIASGEYRDEGEVVVRALVLLSEHDRRAALEAALDEGEADLAAGRFIETSTEEELDEFFATL